MQTYPPTPEAVDILAQEDEVVFYDAASNWQRLANWILDLLAYYLVLFMFFVGVGIVIAINEPDTYEETIDGLSELFYNLMFIVTYLLFMTCIEGFTKGRSLGKWITRTKVVNYHGQPINFKQAFLRSLCRFVPFEVLSIFFSGTPWHDTWTNTQVIKSQRY